jgi:hypothetical protein
MADMNNKLVVVLGMHRSGTSAVTRSLQVMGVGLGDRLMPATAMEGNAKGFWEDLDLNVLNNELLNAIGSNWHYLAPVEPRDVETLRKNGYFVRAVELLRKKVESTLVFGFKDPRVAKLLPFWKEVFKHCHFEVSYVLALRNPLSVVKSLAQRDYLDAEKSYLMWLDHVIRGLIWSEGSRRVLVDYDRLMQSPGHEISRIAAALEFTVDSAELESYTAEFLDEGLRHTTFSPQDLLHDDACPPLVRDIYGALLSVASGSVHIDANSLQTQLSHWSSELARMRSSLTLVDKFFVKNVGLNQSLTERFGQIGLLNQSLSDGHAQINELSRTLSERNRQITALNQTLLESHAQIAEFSLSLPERNEQITRLDHALGDTRALVNELNLSLSERNGQITSLNHALSESHGQIVELSLGLTERNEQITRLDKILSESHGQNVQLGLGLTERNGQITSLNHALGESHVQVTQLSVALSERNGQIAQLSQALGESHGQTDQLNLTLDERCRQIAELSQALGERDVQLTVLEKQLNAIQLSRFWRATSPLRALGAIFVKPKRRLKTER